MPNTCAAPGIWDVIADAPYLSKQQWQAANLLILCQIIVANGANPDMSTCTVAGLWDTVKGNPPFISDQQFYAENLNLLCQLLAGGGGGGGGTDYLIWRDASNDLPNYPDNELPPADLTKVWDVKFRDGTPGLRWDVVAQAWG